MGCSALVTNRMGARCCFKKMYAAIEASRQRPAVDHTLQKLRQNGMDLHDEMEKKNAAKLWDVLNQIGNALDKLKIW